MTAQVDLRQATLSESAQLIEADGSTFLSLDHPPPVRSLLRVTIGDEQRAFEVGRVIEVVGEGESSRGCYGKFVELERLEVQVQVGSEHLEPGISGSAVPAPVVIMNTAEMMLGEVGDEVAEMAAANAASEPDESDGGDAAVAGDDSEPDDNADSDDDGSDTE